MNYSPKLDIPPELENYREAIESIVKPYIRILLTEDNKPKLWQSKFGGLPYMPKNFDYPKSNDGEYLHLLAQINFVEVPSLKELPEQGILQFYIAQDMSYGYDSKNMMKQNRFRVIYFENVDVQEQNMMTDFSFLNSIGKYSFPIEGYSAIKFQFDYTTVDDSYSDCFNIFDVDELSEDIYEMYEMYLDEITLAGHKLLGNPHFTQQDPRHFIHTEEPFILLFQIDSDINRYIDIMWGDSGVANFFIAQSDLEKLDFTKVMYNWDCC